MFNFHSLLSIHFAPIHRPIPTAWGQSQYPQRLPRFDHCRENVRMRPVNCKPFPRCTRLLHWYMGICKVAGIPLHRHLWAYRELKNDLRLSVPWLMDSSDYSTFLNHKYMDYNYFLIPISTAESALFGAKWYLHVSNLCYMAEKFSCNKYFGWVYDKIC